jgi:hypothetical protein
MILSTFAIRVADGQFMSAMVISPQSAVAEDPKTVIADAMYKPVIVLSFIIPPKIYLLRKPTDYLNNFSNSRIASLLQFLKYVFI